MDLVSPDSKEKVIGKLTLQSLLSLPVDCRGEVQRWIYPYRFSIFIAYKVLKGNQVLKMLPNFRFPTSLLHLT